MDPLLVIVVLVLSLVGALLGKMRGRIISGVVWTIVLGPIGWLVVLLMKDLRPACPQCKEVIKPDTRTCPHCRKELRYAHSILNKYMKGTKS